jgi:hypothetical protein
MSNELRPISEGKVGERAEVGVGVESGFEEAVLERLTGRNVSKPSGAASIATRWIVGMVFLTNCDLVIFDSMSAKCKSVFSRRME